MVIKASSNPTSRVGWSAGTGAAQAGGVSFLAEVFTGRRHCNAAGAKNQCHFPAKCVPNGREIFPHDCQGRNKLKYPEFIHIYVQLSTILPPFTTPARARRPLGRIKRMSQKGGDWPAARR
jgi:hypothetical protein